MLKTQTSTGDNPAQLFAVTRSESVKSTVQSHALTLLLKSGLEGNAKSVAEILKEMPNLAFQEGDLTKGALQLKAVSIIRIAAYARDAKMLKTLYENIVEHKVLLKKMSQELESYKEQKGFHYNPTPLLREMKAFCQLYPQERCDNLAKKQADFDKEVNQRVYESIMNSLGFVETRKKTEAFLERIKVGCSQAIRAEKKNITSFHGKMNLMLSVLEDQIVRAVSCATTRLHAVGAESVPEGFNRAVYANEIIESDSVLKSTQVKLLEARKDFRDLVSQTFGKRLANMPAHYASRLDFVRYKFHCLQSAGLRIRSDIRCLEQYHNATVNKYDEFVRLLNEECLKFDKSLPARTIR